MTAHTSQTTSKQHRLPSVERAAGCSPTITKRKKLSIVAPPPPPEESHEPQSQTFGNPKRRFQRRNSKCPSMFYQMLSPSHLMQLHRDADEVRSPQGSPGKPADRKEWNSNVSNALPSNDLREQEPYKDNLKAFRPSWKEQQRLGASSSSSYTYPRKSKSATLTILTEALKLSSAHLREEQHFRGRSE